jgi:Concanavalin A-like lectin/glucanases superfamily
MARGFNGTSDLIDLGSSTTLKPTSGMTFSGWVNGSSFPHSFNAVITAFNANYIFMVQDNGTLYLACGINAVYQGGSHTLSTATWYNLSFTITSGGTGTGYVNGAVDGGPAAGGGPVAGDGSDVNIGNDGQTAGRNWTGALADFAIWNVVLSAAEILALANGARPGTVRPKSLVAWLPLGGFQSPEPDLSGNAFNGTLTGTNPAFGPPLMRMSLRTPQIFVPAAVAAAGTLGGGTSIRPSVRQGWQW